MRRALIPTALAALLLAVPAASASADPVEKRDVVPFDYTFEMWNPCTEEVANVRNVGELDIFALPSIEAFYTDTWSHLTMKWSSQFTGDDGYTSKDQHYSTLVGNISDDDQHVVLHEIGNSVHTGEDGGKFKASYRFQVRVLDGELTTFVDDFDLRCIRQPAS
ncbi:MAG: hypothetical protein QNJ12_14430 [Ilumatobacter sp.]|uniref:hypothetical protein n=1 Tax=Ilumatobacter sp. TaxID=1967498 RepID=UPI002615FB59|nr:hypothetical protein [Ilumatobacter sp.]MDJ0769994.1 hypothetical protein [Ilumatobacter sp.]